ncbi:MAG: hypothetical protein WCK27_18545 [Verrucomicrobiota bacterium]
MPHTCTEDQEAPRTLTRPLLFCEPSPQPLPAGEEPGEEVWVDESGLFGQETKGEVVLVPRLRAALERLNPALPPEAITSAVDGCPTVENLKMP